MHIVCRVNEKQWDKVVHRGKREGIDTDRESNTLHIILCLLLCPYNSYSSVGRGKAVVLSTYIRFWISILLLLLLITFNKFSLRAERQLVL